MTAIAGYPESQGYPLGYGQYSVTAATVLNNTLGANAIDVPVGTDRMQINVSGNAIRYRDDGVAPTTGVGVPVAADTMFIYAGSPGKFTVISQSGTAVLDVSFYGTNAPPITYGSNPASP